MRIKTHVEELERRKSQSRGLYIKETLNRFGIPFHSEPVSGWFRRGENIIVDYPFGVSEADRRPRILLTAHFDAVPWAPGANDNASGVSVLLELLRKLKEEALRLETPVRFIFFDLEEGLPFRGGSRAYVRRHGTGHIDRLVNLEMVGMGEVLMLWGPDDDSRSREPLRKLANGLGIPVINRPSLLRISPWTPFPAFFSDHVSFGEAGFARACSLTMLPVEDLAFQDVIDRRDVLRFLRSAFRYSLTRGGDFPKILRHYHRKGDRAEFVEEKTLENVFDLVWSAYFL